MNQILRGGLSAMIICWMVFPIFSQFNPTKTICQGESVFLDALQSFPQGPQPPQGVSPCRPQLQDIEISPATNVLKVDKRGFLVVPLVTTTYEVISIPTCGRPGFGGTVSPPPGAITRTFQVIVDNSCQAENGEAAMFTVFSWLREKVNPSNCNGESITIYNGGLSDTDYYVYVEEVSGQQTLYRADGSIFCQNAPETDLDCIAAIGFTSIASSWTCGINNTTFPTGNNLPCDPTKLSWIRREIQPTFCGAIPTMRMYYNGEETYFERSGGACGPDGNIPTYFNCQGVQICVISPLAPEINPCSDELLSAIGEGNLVWSSDCDCPPENFPVLVKFNPTTSRLYRNRCITECRDRMFEIIPPENPNPPTPLFEQYPWLSTIINEQICSGASIQVYEQGIFNFLLVTNERREEILYFEDGTLYCTNSPTFDCVAAYNLGQPIDTWRCPDPVACPAVFDPVCGVDGNTYSNGCEAGLAGVQVAFRGECPSVQPPINCEGFTGTVIENECGTFIQIDESASTGSLVSPLYETGVIIPSVGDIVEFSYRGLGAADNFCLGRPTTAGSVSCLKIVGAITPATGIFEDYPWLVDFANPNSCTNEKVEVFQSGIYFFLLVTDANGQSVLYNQDGQFYCQQTFSYNCVAAYNLGNPIETWRCPTGIEEAVVITTAACIGERFEFNHPPTCNGRQIETPTTNDIIQHIGDIGSTSTVIATLKSYGSFERFHLVPNSEGDCDRVLHIYEMVEKEGCGMEEEPPSEIPSVYEDYPWLIDVLAPIDCKTRNGEKIIFFNDDPARGVSSSTALEMYQSGGFTYFLVQYEPSIYATLFFQDGSPLCTNSMGFDCVEAYGLGTPVASWFCVNPDVIPCTDDVSPVCGADGRTYSNECEAQRVGVAIIANGECLNIPPELPDEIFLDYSWLTDIINPNNCSNERIEVYQSGIYKYILVRTSGAQGTLYNQEGLVYCQQTANYDCVAAYNLGQPIDSWLCNPDIACPAVVIPACGVDGNTYDINPCVMSNGDIEIAYRGVCDPGPIVCDMFRGNVIENECGLYIVVSNQYWRPIFLNGVTLPSGGDIVEFAFFPRSLSDYPDDGCLTSPNGTPPIVGVVSCLNVTNQRSFDETYTICPGESVFLEAKRSGDFAVGTGSTCFPLLNDIKIFPTTDTRKDGTTNYRYIATPQQTTIYAIESITSCPDVYGPIQSTRYYQVIVEDNCFGDLDCNTISQSIVSSGTIVETACNEPVVNLDANDSGLTGLVRMFYSPCVEQPNQGDGTKVEIEFIAVPMPTSCPPAMEGAGIYVIDIKPLDNQEDCTNETGTIFFENCDNGQLYYFIETEEGRIFDPYFDATITFTPVDGQKVNFGYVDATFPTPCSNAEKAITITCIETIATSNPSNQIFSDYPWLSSQVDTDNCSGIKVEVYDFGTYQFVFIEVDGLGSLYYQDGTFYCQDSPNYDCRAAYKLANPSTTWSCNGNLQERNEDRTRTIARLEGFVAYPNPTLGSLQVQLPALQYTAQLRMINLFGQVIIEQEIPPSPFQQTVSLDLEDHQNGIYYLELRTKKKRGIERILKQDLR